MGLYAKMIKYEGSSRRDCKRKRREKGTVLLSLLLILVIVISGCGAFPQSSSDAGGSSAPNTAEETAEKAAPSEIGSSNAKRLTLMIYLCGSDLESKTGAATKDLEEIVSSGVNTDLVNVVVMAGGTTQWQNGFSHEETAVYALAAESASPESDAGGAAESGSPEGDAGGAAESGSPESDAGGAAESASPEGDAGGAAESGSPEGDAGGAAESASPESDAGGAAGNDKGSGKDVSNGAGTGLTWEKKEAFASQEVENAPANMGESGTLKSFLDYSHDQFPADRYALILWDHGGGPMRGLCWDTAWAKDCLTMEELTGALESSPFAEEALSWIGFDACLMSSVETAHLVAPYAEYMIASEETEPCIGWSYDYLAGIEKDKNGGETGVRIIDSFITAGEAASEAADKESSLTLACMDLSQLANVEEKMDSFFAELGESLSPESFSELSNLREDTREFGKAMTDSQRYDLVDLGDLVTHCESQAPEKAAALKEALDQMVIYSKSSLDNCHGLSSYHPYYNKTYYEKMWRDEYDSFAFVPNYTEYIKEFAEIWLGDAMGDWTQMSRVQSAGVTDETQYFSVQLTPEQAQYYADSELLLLTKVGDEEHSGSGAGYSQVFRTDDVTLDEKGVLTAGYSGKTLYAVDENNEILAGPLGYTISDDGNYMIQANYINQESGAEQRVTHAMFECADAPAGMNLPILEQYVGDEETGTWSNRIELVESDYQYVILLHDYKEPAYDGERILPFSEWKDAGWSGGNQVFLPETIRFRFYDHILNGSQLYACFEISDTQANLYGTELMDFQNPNLTSILFREGISDTERIPGPEGGDPDLNAGGDTPEQGSAAGGRECVFANENLRMRVSGLLDRSEETASLRLHIVWENLSDRPLNASVENGIRFSDASRTRICMPTEGGISLYHLAPGETEAMDVVFDGKVLAGLASLQQISFTLNDEKKMPDDSGGGEEQTETDGAEETEAPPGAGETGAESGGNAQKLEVVLHPVDLDVSAVSGGKEYSDNPEGLAVCSKDQMLWTLCSAEQRQGGNIEFGVVVKNEGAEPAAMKFPEEISVNGITLDAYVHERSENQVVDPGEEFSFVARAWNSQSGNEFFDHLGGSEHLTISDVLGTEGVREVRTVSFYLMDQNMYQFEMPDGDWESPPVYFALSDPVPLKKRNSIPVGDDPELSSGEPGSDALSGEEMTRSLDSDGNTPVRTEIYSRDGLTVFGEHILVADQTILMSFLLENKSEKNKIVRFYELYADDLEISTFHSSEISYASSRKRIILKGSKYGELDDDSVNNMSMMIWQDTKPARDIKEQEDPASQGRDQTDPGTDQNGEKAAADRSRGLPIIQQVDLSLPAGTAFNVDGGRSFGFEDTRMTVNCLTDEKVDGDLFEKKVVCPENPDQYRKTFSFTLPDSLSEEEKNSVTGVIMTAQRDCTAETDPENKKHIQDSLSKAGIEDPSPLCLQFLTYTGMKRSEEKPDTFSGSLSGLMCVHQDDPDISYVMRESTDDDGKIRFAKKESDVFDTWYIMPKEWCDDTYIDGVEYDMTITLRDGSASLDEFVIHDRKFDDSEYAIPYSIAPLNWLESMKYTLTVLAFVHEEDGTLQNQPAEMSTGYYRVNTEIPVNGGNRTLELLPFEECGSGIRLVYYVYFEDGSCRLYDGGPLF